MAKRIEGPYDYGKHGFHRFADGDNWELYQGRDFDIQPKSYAQAAREWGKSEGFEVDYKVIDRATDPRVVLRFRRHKAVRSLSDQRTG